ncbi:MAG: PKD domain-containing protein [Candidatus Thermoplasmatota archaeon]
MYIKKLVFTLLVALMLFITSSSMILADLEFEKNTFSSFDLDFNVKNNSGWVKEIEKPVGTHLRFKIVLDEAYGSYLTVTAVLPEMLSYINATPEPCEIKPNQYGGVNINWYNETAGDSRVYYFQAEITEDQTNNCLATSVILIPPQSDNETVTITGTSQQPPTLEADAGGPYKGNISEEIQFRGSAEGGVPPYSYLWDFGDGKYSEQKNPVHSYSSIGNYTAHLTVTDSRNVTAEDSSNITIKKKGEEEEDEVDPFVKISKPRNGFYLLNKRIFPFPNPLIVGKVKVEINCYDNDSGISHVNIFLDDSLVVNLSEKPYVWNWEKPSFGSYRLKAVAFDQSDNKNIDQIIVWKFF